MVEGGKPMTQPELPWKKSPSHMGNRLHTICSYMAMFPPSIPNYFIKKYSEEGDIILDPFSGRGTTALEACSLKRIGVGNDRNPLAHMLTSAKVHVPEREKIIARIRELSRKYQEKQSNQVIEEDWKIRMLFHEYTLKQLCFLRENLRWKSSPTDIFITAMLLGILHGSSDGYLSISMPNTFSMAPNYVKNYIKKHNLQKPKRDVFQLLLRKLDRCYQIIDTPGKAYNQDARNLHQIDNKSVKLVITSPPYTRVIRYGAFNWIRLWLLKKNEKDVDRKLFCSQSLPKYGDFMKSVLKETKRVLCNKGKVVLVIGDVRNRETEKSENLAEYIWEYSAQPLGFSKICQYEDNIDEGTKVSKIWGDTKGRATKTDRILVLQK